MDIYTGNSLSVPKISKLKKIEYFFRKIFLISSSIFAVLIPLVILDKSNTFADLTENFAKVLVIVWFSSFSAWMVSLLLGSRLAMWIKSLFQEGNIKKRKIGVGVFILWLISLLIVFCFVRFETDLRSNLPRLLYDAIPIISFFSSIFLFPIWAFLIANRFIKIVSIIPISLCIVLLVLYFIALRPHKTRGNLMEPSLQSNSYFLSEKVSYYFSKPKRGDIVVYRSVSGERVGRIVGLPDEKISVLRGKVLINGNEFKEPYARWDYDEFDSPFYFTLRQNEFWIPFDVRIKSDLYLRVTGNDILSKAFYVYWPSGIGLIKSPITSVK